MEMHYIDRNTIFFRCAKTITVCYAVKKEQQDIIRIDTSLVYLICSFSIGLKGSNNVREVRPKDDAACPRVCAGERVTCTHRTTARTLIFCMHFDFTCVSLALLFYFSPKIHDITASTAMRHTSQGQEFIDDVSPCDGMKSRSI